MRSFARRINALTGQKAAAKNHLHALNATSATPKAVLKNPKLAITQLEKRIDRLTAETLILIGKHPELKRILTLLIGIKGKRNRLDFKQSIYAALILQSPDSVIR